MKTINESPHDFFQQGGWSFLGGAGGEEVGFKLLSAEL
jgi:nucleosome binding factor SPN SPT16 subunit